MSESGIAERNETTNPREVIQERGDEVSESVFNMRHKAWHEALENDEAPHVHYWDEATVDRVRKHNPSIFVPVGVDAETATPLEVYQSIPFNPFEMSDNHPETGAAIIAAGLPTEPILLEDKEGTLSDDAIRSFLEDIHLDDPDMKYLHNRLMSIARERFPESSVTTASSFLTYYFKMRPAFWAALVGVRMIINTKNTLYGPFLDIVGPHIEYLDDSQRYARLKHLTRPVLELTEDSQLRVADVTQVIPEALDWLEKERGITGSPVCLIDEEHSVAGTKLWEEEERQKKVLQKTVARIYDIREELANTENKLLTDNEVADLSDEVTEFLGTVRIFDVKKRPYHLTRGQVEKALPVAHEFVSQKVRSVVEEAIQKMRDPDDHDLDIIYHEPQVNNF